VHSLSALETYVRIGPSQTKKSQFSALSADGGTDAAKKHHGQESLLTKRHTGYVFSRQGSRRK
jgi:hypothetical protein